MNAKVTLLAALGLLLLNHVRFMLVVNEVDNRRPRVPVVDIVAKARSVDDGELDLELLLLKLGLDYLDLSEFEIIKAELEEKQFKVKLTVIDTPGFGDYVNNRDSWSPIVDFIDDQHEAYMIQEQQPQRSEKSDLRVHACLYFIRPTCHT